mmetsp:Transcript_42823/g.103564  ORF Transcript_42823/g.103564 Transcript_42823/m.103564 type:complete len:83 (+) Transcript_42823:255-503(+)
MFDVDFGDEAEDDDLSLLPMRGGSSAAVAVAAKNAKTVSVLMRQPVIIPIAMEFGRTNGLQPNSNTEIGVVVAVAKRNFHHP